MVELPVQKRTAGGRELVAEWYIDSPQVSDAEVQTILKKSRRQAENSGLRPARPQLGLLWRADCIVPRVVLFALHPYEAIGADILDTCGETQPGCFRVSRFANGELRVDLQTAVADQRCLVLGSIAPPDEQMLSLLLLVSTLQKERASAVTAILPYLAYARQDKDKPGQSLAAAWAGSLLKASGCDRVITVDAHSERAKRLFPIPVISVSPASVFASAIQRLGLTQATLVAPDEGAIARCDAVKAAAGLHPSMTPYFEKHRTETGITHADLTGAVSRQAVIIDDILDTGSTLVSACEKLIQAGVDDIEIMVTHGLFTGTHWRRLWQFGVKRIFCTDTVPAPHREQHIVELSIAPLLAEAMHDL